jgi:hypothetical protein
VPDWRRAYYLKRAVAAADAMPFVSALSWYGFLPDSTTPPQWAIATADGQASWTYQALADLAVDAGPTVRLPARSKLRPGDTPIRPVLDGLNPTGIAHTELYVDGTLQAESDGPDLLWHPNHHTHATGKTQIVVYTHDHHAWPSNILDTGTGQ